MPRFDAHLGHLFTEVPFLERFAAAAAVGFTAVEFPFPYAYAPGELAQRLASHGLVQVSIMAPAGDWAAGERGLAAIPGRAREFRDGMRRALEYADALNVARVHVAAGLIPEGADVAACEALFLENLAHAADLARPRDVTILIEPVSGKVYPTFLVRSTAHGERILATIRRDNVRLLYDVWHSQLGEGDLAATIERVMPLIAHLQIANPPGRNEPGVGEIHFPFLFDLIDRLGYTGWVGLEYRPSTDTLSSLRWARPYGIRA
jgi:hydroxypyruvate isomerase